MHCRPWKVGMAAVAVVGAVLASGPAAMAKGGPVEYRSIPDCYRTEFSPCPGLTVAVRGPGLGRPLWIRGRDARRMMYLTAMLWRPFNMPAPDPTPRSKLGPRFSATYTSIVMTEGGLRTRSFRQDLYPNGPRGVWSNTPAGQPFPWKPVEAGWWRSSTLRDVLVAHGLPAVPSGASPGSAAVPGRADDPWPGLILLAAGLAASAVLARRRELSRAR